jgi:hypothetical protein
MLWQATSPTCTCLMSLNYLVCNTNVIGKFCVKGICWLDLLLGYIPDPLQVQFG